MNAPLIFRSLFIAASLIMIKSLAFPQEDPAQEHRRRQLIWLFFFLGMSMLVAKLVA